MGFDGLKFGSGPKELGGSVDLISHYKLLPHHEFFCKRSLPLSISGTHYLQSVVGDREIRKGVGMELDQLFQDATLLRQKSGCIHPFRVDVLANVLHMQETTPASLSSPERGIPTTVTKLESKSKERHHKKHKDRDRHKIKDHKKQKRRSKDRDDSEARDKSINGPLSNGSGHLKNQEKKKRTIGVSTHPLFKGIK